MEWTQNLGSHKYQITALPFAGSMKMCKIISFFLSLLITYLYKALRIPNELLGSLDLKFMKLLGHNKYSEYISYPNNNIMAFIGNYLILKKSSHAFEISKSNCLVNLGQHLRQRRKVLFCGQHIQK